MMKLIEDEKTG